jgi:hypothetical protein
METKFKVGDKVVNTFGDRGTVVSTTFKDKKTGLNVIHVVYAAYNGYYKSDGTYTPNLNAEPAKFATYIKLAPIDTSLEEAITRLKVKMETPKFTEFFERYKAENGL